MTSVRHEVVNPSSRTPVHTSFSRGEMLVELDEESGILGYSPELPFAPSVADETDGDTIK